MQANVHSSPPSAVPLGYGPSARRFSRRAAQRAVLLILMVTVAVCAWHWGPSVYRRGEYLYWQRRCLNYTAPPDWVVYEEDPATAQALLASGRGYQPAPPGVPASKHFQPVVLAMHRPPGIEKLIPGVREGVAFSHRRRSPRGNERLVVIQFGVAGNPEFGYTMGINRPDVLSLASWSKSPSVLSRPTFGFIGMIPDWAFEQDDRRGKIVYSPGFRLFAGQPDRVDESHFTIGYEFRDREPQTYAFPRRDDTPWQRGTIDGWLRDDDTVEMKVRDGPLSQVPDYAFGGRIAIEE